jgi:hypothetical protein
MNKKLTLNIDDNLIKFAHEYSKKTKQSISAMVEKYFSMLREDKETDNLSQLTNDLYGIFSDNPLPDKETMRKEFHEKNIN